MGRPVTLRAVSTTSRTENPAPLPRFIDAVLPWLRRRRLVGRLQCQEVGATEVLDVDVVADSSAIGGRVVIAKDFHGFPLPESGLEDQRDQLRLRLVVLA
jgi:hypothetical protein